MEGSTARVPVVDDYEPFRRFVRSTLERRPELQVIAEAADGLEAVQKAEELHSDLILLDVGLPTLNGIEAARRIRKLSPRIPDTLRESRIFCRRGARSSSHWGDGLHRQNARQKRFVGPR